MNDEYLGLSSKKANEQLKIYGRNIIPHKDSKFYNVLARQFRSPLIYLLIIASAISFFLSDLSEGVTITCILLINALLGFTQEYRSEKAIEKLSTFIGKEGRVKRDGKIRSIDQGLIVPDDLVILKEGDIVSADIKILKQTNLLINESSFTGESFPKEKTVGDILFSGSTIEKGEAAGIVLKTGKNSQLGKIASLASNTVKHTQYEKSLTQFSSFLMRVVLFLLILTLILKLVINSGSLDIISSLLFILALAIAVVPEALPVIATLTMANGAMKLAKKHVIVKRLSSLEDLGNVNVLCTDKTGTLTENKLTVKRLESDNTDLFMHFALSSMDEEDQKHLNAFDKAFKDFATKEQKMESKKYTQIDELPFDPQDKRRRVVLKDTKENYFLIEIGATESLLSLAKEEGEDILSQIEKDGKEGLRNIAILYKKIHYSNEYEILKDEKDLSFLGYAAFLDPLKPSALQTIHLSKNLGIEIKIITGDSREVSSYIARQIGLINEEDKIYTGDELDRLSKEDFKSAIKRTSVFARVNPVQKYNIIKILKEDNVVGYQGDGINDTLALKEADVAIAVEGATDVAKDSADIIILKKDLEVIINGIKYGRVIFININKYIKYTMVGNFGNFISLLSIYLISYTLPLLPVQLLLTSLITDIPLITISSDNVDNDEIIRPEKHDTLSLILISVILGSITALFEFIFFSFIGLRSNSVTQTNLFVFITIIQLVVIFSIRSTKHFLNQSKPSNLLLFSIILTFIVSVSLPFLPLSSIFSFTSLNIYNLLLILLLSFTYFIVLDIVKVWYYNMDKSRGTQ